MKNILVVVDMQKDFVDGSLGTGEAAGIVPLVREKIDSFDGEVLYTRDTHHEDYLSTQEGHNLPVIHCIKGTEGWQIIDELSQCRKDKIFNKPSFGSVKLCKYLKKLNKEETIDSITLIGLCTDICVISNAMMIKAYLPEAKVIVDAACCAGVTPASHGTALKAMKACQIEVVGEE